jgi:hypothetical protein
MITLSEEKESAGQNQGYHDEYGPNCRHPGKIVAFPKLPSSTEEGSFLVIPYQKTYFTAKRIVKIKALSEFPFSQHTSHWITHLVTPVMFSATACRCSVFLAALCCSASSRTSFKKHC